MTSEPDKQLAAYGAIPAPVSIERQRIIERLRAKASGRELRNRNGKLSRSTRIQLKAAWISGRYATHTALAVAFGVSPETIHRLAKLESWDAARSVSEPLIASRVRVEAEDLAVEMRLRHLEHAHQLQAKGREALDVVVPEDVSDAVRLIEAGVKMERQAVGVDDLASQAVDGLLSGEIIAAAFEKQRIVLVRGGVATNNQGGDG